MEFTITNAVDLGLTLLAAIALALPTAWHRESSSRVMGLRTFPLVSLGACAYVVVGEAFIGPSDPNAMARIVQGLITGVGFIGGGAILKNDDNVKGTATAASIWITGALGAAVGLHLWLLAVLLSVFNFFIVFVFSLIKPKIPPLKDC